MTSTSGLLLILDFLFLSKGRDMIFLFGLYNTNSAGLESLRKFNFGEATVSQISLFELV